MVHLASPREFYAFSLRWSRRIGSVTALLMLVGLYLGLFVAPPDYQQGDSYRIMFVHVPSAWMSLFVYSILAGAGAVVLIWRVKVAEVVAAASAPIGAAFTALALATGSIWGKPMWGTFWS